MRTFISIEFNKDIKDRLSDYLLKLKTGFKKGSFTPVENMHLTMKFLGEINSLDIELILEAMQDAAVRNKKFEMQIDQLGFFTRELKNIIWVGIKENKPLNKLHNDLEKSMARQGFAREKKAFSPHVTLGREVEFFYDKQKLLEENKPDITNVLVNSICLMQSVRQGPTLIYKKLHEIPLN